MHPAQSGEICSKYHVFLIVFTEAKCPEWSELEQAMISVHCVVHGLVDFSKVSVGVFVKRKPILSIFSRIFVSLLLK